MSVVSFALKIITLVMRQLVSSVHWSFSTVTVASVLRCGVVVVVVTLTIFLLWLFMILPIMDMQP